MPQNFSTIKLAHGRLNWSSDYPAAKPKPEGPFATASWSQLTRSLSLTLSHDDTSTGQLVGIWENPTWGSLEEEQINTSGKAVMTWIVPNKVIEPKIGSPASPFPQSAYSWKPDKTRCFRKEQSSGKNTGLRRCGTQILVLPHAHREPDALKQEGAPMNEVRTVLPPRLGIRIKSKLHRIWNALKAILPSVITEIFMSELRGKGVMRKLRKTSDSSPWMPNHTHHHDAALSCMTGHPNLPRISHILGILHPGTIGHLLLPFSVNQTNCDYSTYHLREKGYIEQLFPVT